MTAHPHNDPAARYGVPIAPAAGRLRMDGATKRAIDVGRTRLLIAATSFVLAYLVICGRLIDLGILQLGAEPRITDNHPVAEMGEDGTLPELETTRADIVDRNGALLATSLFTQSLYANPHLITDAKDVTRRLAEILPGLNLSETEARLGSDKSFVWLKRNLTPRETFLVNNLGVPGLDFQREERRVYPEGRLTAHVVGFTDLDGRGVAGAEASFDDMLHGHKQSIALSIDARMQHVMREELAGAMAEFNAIGAGGILLDVHTGEVLSLVSLPDFDPHSPGSEIPEARFNRMTLGVYELGSMFKLFTTAMALDLGTIKLTSGYNAANPIHVGRFTIDDYKGQHRYLTIPEILIYSSNIGAALMAKDVGPERHKAFMEKLGMLRPLSLELPELGTPIWPKPWREINTLTIGFGHGIAVTPLHLVTAMASIVNGGQLRPATLLKRDYGNGNNARYAAVENAVGTDAIDVVGEQVIKPEISVMMRHLMRLVVEKGSGKAANIPGYLVGGKTGTAEKLKRTGGYDEGNRISSFVAAFPIDNPRYVILGLLDEPKGNKATYGYATAGWVSAPMVGRMIARIAPMAGIPPQQIENPPAKSAKAETAPVATTVAAQSRGGAGATR